MNISFRLATEADLDVIDPILVSAYGFKGSRKNMLRFYLALQPDGWWLACADGTPVGFGGAVDYGAFSSVGMFSVLPAWQRRGIGHALTGQVLAWAEARGCPALILEAEELAVSLYARHGFIEEGSTLLLLREEGKPSPQSATQLETIQATSIPELVAYDRQYFGAQRAKIFLSLLQTYPGRAFLTRNAQGNITGYVFASPRTIGPWIADTLQVAECLLLHALSLPFEHGPDVTIPVENEEGLQLLNRLNFRQVNLMHYMRWGSPVHVKRNTIYAETSPALG